MRRKFHKAAQAFWLSLTQPSLLRFPRKEKIELLCLVSPAPLTKRSLPSLLAGPLIVFSKLIFFIVNLEEGTPYAFPKSISPQSTPSLGDIFSLLSSSNCTSSTWVLFPYQELQAVLLEGKATWKKRTWRRKCHTQRETCRKCQVSSLEDEDILTLQFSPA